MIEMIRGAAKELVTGDPALLITDVGPVIDAEAYDGIQKNLQRLRIDAKQLLSPADTAQRTAKSVASLIAPQAFEVNVLRKAAASGVRFIDW